MKQQFTIYRPTNNFMASVNSDAVKLDQHRNRTSYNTLCAIKAANDMLNNGDLIPAATVDCEKSDLFELTNTISRAWYENDEVVVISNDVRLYSTSIGDVFTNQEGQFYIVGPSDFIPFNRE